MLRHAQAMRNHVSCLRLRNFDHHSKRKVTTTRIAVVQVLELINAFRNRGHFAALLDPLGAERISSWLPDKKDEYPDVIQALKNYPYPIDLKPFKLEKVSLGDKVDLGKSEQYNKFNDLTLRELVAQLVDCYCGSVGVELSHIENNEHRRWLEDKVENDLGPRNWAGLSEDNQILVLKQLMSCDLTAQFLNEKFSAAKVFGIEGCESLIPGIHALFQSASAHGMESVEMGMAHRGRMNVLVNVFDKPLRSICNKFNETDPSELGDVKYHLGTRAVIDVPGIDGITRQISLSLAANPSHLEAVNPVVIGKTKAKQFYLEESTEPGGMSSKHRVMPVLLHGDAAFSGQGIVPEVLELSNLPDYTVGGCVHIIINNQIGFTTDPRLARTSYHCTSVAKGIGAPIFHVNGDDVEAVVAVCKLAGEWRQKFLRDCVVDIVCYRRHGHNSLDDPSITQPKIYKLINSHPAIVDIYSRQLLNQNVITKDALESMRSEIQGKFDEEFEVAKSYKSDPLEWLASNWRGEAIGSLISTRPYNQTGVRIETLRKMGHHLTIVPPHFKLHKDIEKLIEARKKMLDTGEGITMAFAEALAFACLMTKYVPESALAESNETFDIAMQEHPTVHVRLSGQDCIRGTFNQRHAAIVCQRTNESYWQLNHLGVEQAQISVCNSSLSEAAILGFEYGYSLSNDMALTIWEAQFGDFANVAQSIIDNFIVSGEFKWNNKSSLVMLLPHGYDGQGPEHSSARLERFLQLVDDDSDSIPGTGSYSTNDINSMFKALAEDVNKSTSNSASTSSSSGSLKMTQDIITRESFTKAIQRLAPDTDSERIDLSFAEIISDYCDLTNRYDESDVEITKEVWHKLMVSWLQSNSERRHNLIVIVPSTPAQYFHCLRRQIHRPFAKPLVVMSAKWLLHHKACASPLEDLAEGTFFHRVIVEGGKGDNTASRRVSGGKINTTQTPSGITSETLVEPEKIRKVIFCSGSVFYHLFHARSAAKINDITFVRLEQIAPFPFDLVGPIIQKYPNADLLWVQEEPKNMGAWSYIKPRFDTTCREEKLQKSIRYVGRHPCASPATGGYKQHFAEQKSLIAEALLSETKDVTLLNCGHFYEKGYLTFVLLSWSYEAASLRSIKRNDRSYSEDDNDYNPRYKYVSNQALTDSKYHGLIDCESTVTNLCPQSSLSFVWSQCVLFNVPLEVFAQCNAYLDSFPTFHVTIACADEISEFCSDLDPSLIPDCLIRVALYSEDECTLALRTYMSVKNSVSILYAVNESMVEKYGVDSDKDENLSREALSQPPAAADYLRGSIEKVLPQVEDGEEGNFFDVWGLLELFFSYSNDELTDDLIKSETVNDIDVLSDDEDKEDDHVTEDSMKSEESKPFVPSMYSRFLRFAEYMFDSFSDDDDDDECFDDTTANCSNFRHSQTL